MKITAAVLASMPNPYVARKVDFSFGTAVIVASEGAGAVVRIDPKQWDVTTVSEGPGGCLDIVPVPGRDAVFMIGGSNVGYDFHRSAVYVAGVTEAGSPVRLFDLPFLHRLHSYANGTGVVVLAATIALTKSDRDDWCRPGALFAAEIPGNRLAHALGNSATTGRRDGGGLDYLPADAPIPLRPVLPELHKNHGLLARGRWIYISGEEGMYRAAIPELPEERWRFHKIFNGEVSEMAFLDIDQDGRDEMVTIEPFHGDELVVYDTVDDAPAARRETRPIAFGHGLWAGPVNGVPSVIVGNRSGHKNLELLQWTGEQEPAVVTIAEGTGTAQVTVVHHPGGDHIVATNQETAQIVRYTVER